IVHRGQMQRTSTIMPGRPILKSKELLNITVVGVLALLFDLSNPAIDLNDAFPVHHIP
ncbi:unnamed protein product, partial [marine sediment metagenome]